MVIRFRSQSRLVNVECRAWDTVELIEVETHQVLVKSRYECIEAR